jgi:hypothetical protein
VRTSYCQYPIIKKIKDDSIIILTVKQGEHINKLYKSYNDTIAVLKRSLDIKNIKYDSLFSSAIIEKDSVYDWKWKYKANREIYIAREKDIQKDKRYDQYVKYLLVFIIVFQFSKIN